MNNETVEERILSLVTSLRELADEIDGLADLGIAVGLAQEEMGGRHLYFMQRSERIQHLVDSVGSSVNTVDFSNLQDLHSLQSDLVASAYPLLKAFCSLEAFRTLSPDAIRSSVEALRAGWERMHQVIRGIAATLGLLDQAWYSTVLERHDSYRSQLEHVGSCFPEVHVAANPK